MKANKHTTPEAWEVTPFEAKEALSHGGEAPLADYFADLAEGLGLVAQHLKSSSKKSATKKSGSNKTPEEVWESSLDQLQVAAKAGDNEPMAAYLLDASEVCARTSQALQAAPEFGIYRLTFKRTGRGRPADPTQQAMKNSHLEMLVRFKVRKVRKVTLAVEEVAKEKGVSRSTVMRAWKGR